MKFIYIITLIFILPYKLFCDNHNYSFKNEELEAIIIEKINKISKDYDIPKYLLWGFVPNENEIKKNKNFNISTYALEKAKKYSIEHENYYLDPYLHSKIENYLNFLSISLIMHKEKINKYLKLKKYEVSNENLWVFASISHLLGEHTTLELINFYTEKNSSRFFQLMLKNDFIMTNFLCNRKYLWKAFRSSLESLQVIEKQDKLLRFFKTVNYCGRKIDEKAKSTKKNIPLG